MSEPWLKLDAQFCTSAFYGAKKVLLRHELANGAVAPGTSVHFLNSDPVLHNIFSPGPEPFDLGTYPQGRERAHRFVTPGIHVVLCNVHPEMALYVVVAAGTHRAVVDRDGSFSLEAVPPGAYTLHLYYPRRYRRESIPLDVPAGGIRGMTLVLTRRGLDVR